MKTVFLKALVLSGVVAPSAFALSLYEIAPPVGMPESYAIKYRAFVDVGYDDNLNSSSDNEQEGAYTRFGVGASYSDQESVTRISYNLSLGARLYAEAAEGTDRKLFSDSSLQASYSHSFSAASMYTTSLSVSMSTQPNYSNSISAPYEQGEYLNWSWSNSYSRAIDSRWSWTASLAYTGQVYTRGSYQEDDRQYLTGGLTLSYRFSALTTYSISTTYRRDFRSLGENSDNVYFNLGVDHSLTSISSVYATLGVQCKMVADNTDLYPNIRFGYRRVIGEGLSANIYFSYDNENIDTGYTANNMYISNQTIRAGMNLNYVWTHKVSFYLDGSILEREYSKHTGGKSDRSDTTWTAALGMRYKFTQRLSASVDYRYNACDRDYGDYKRNQISTGFVYTF